MKISKGDIVGRISYGKDIIFVVDRVINFKNQDMAILKGIFVRIEADAPLGDLQKIDKEQIKEIQKRLEFNINKRIEKYKENTRIKTEKIYTGKILHLDGDKKYTEKSIRYYRKLGLNAVVKNIAEHKQAKIIKTLLEKYRPDILVITGHDAMLKNGSNFNNIYNYRNSRHFVDTVKEARRWQPFSDKLTIFARSLPKFF